AEALDEGGRANVELAGMHRACDDQLCTFRRVDSRAQRTAIERVEAAASPAPAEQREGAHDEQQALRPGDTKGGRPEQAGDDERDGTVHPHRIGGRETETDRSREQLRGAADGDELAHGATRSRSVSSRAGPMPEIASSSSTDPNAPCFWR